MIEIRHAHMETSAATRAAYARAASAIGCTPPNRRSIWLSYSAMPLILRSSTSETSANSPASGFQSVHQWLAQKGKLPEAPQGGGSCGVK